jgi:outer membrane protein assembly factor BamE (lipoprotein component of BamABCDE complex)
MKIFIIACLAAAALASLSACTTTPAKNGQPAFFMGSTTPNPASAPIITDPHGPF